MLDRGAVPGLSFQGTNNVGHLGLPRIVAARPFPGRSVRRAPHRPHFVAGESLYSVASAEAMDLELLVTPGDLEREQVLPLGPRGVKPRSPTTSNPQAKKCIVLDGHGPERSGQFGEAEVD